MKIMLAVNNYQNGTPSGYADMIKVEDILSLEGSKIRCYYKEGRLKFGKHTFRPKEYQCWVGNWCWDCVQLSLEDVARVINYVLRHGWYVFEGEASLWEKFQNLQEITVDDIQLALGH